MDDSYSSSAGMEMIRDKLVVISVRHCRTVLIYHLRECVIR
jgi:hypothetical protein